MIIKNSNIRQALAVNRYKIIALIIAIILVFAVIRILNENAKESVGASSRRPDYEGTNNMSKTTKTPEKTVISGSNVSSKQQEENTKVIDNFINFCNEKNFEQSYNLLSDECKDAVFFNDIQNFKNNYVNKVFVGKKSYNMQSWIKNTSCTYKIEIVDDIISTGNVSNLQNKFQDYYTIDATGKLNINGYIGRQQINKSSENEAVKITVIQKDIFKEYETYKIKVENNTQNTILLDTRTNTDTVYLNSSDNKKFNAFMYEVIDTKLEIEAGRSKEIDIRFNKVYANSTLMSQIVFEDIIVNYEEYKALENKGDYNRLKIKIDI